MKKLIINNDSIDDNLLSDTVAYVCDIIELNSIMLEISEMQEQVLAITDNLAQKGNKGNAIIEDLCGYSFNDICFELDNLKGMVDELRDLMEELLIRTAKHTI